MLLQIINDGNLNNEDDKKNREFVVTTTDGSFIASLLPIGALVGGRLIFEKFLQNVKFLQVALKMFV